MSATERDLIREIRTRLARKDRRISIGIGDDAAVLAGGTVVSVDTIVEDVHFVRGWLSWADVGFRAYSSALSDLAAMAASPTAGLLSYILPAELEDEAVLAITEGAAEASDAYGAPIVGGNISAGAQLSITTTVIGRAEKPITRAGARVGDGVYVTGAVGMAALGWRLLERGAALDDRSAPFISRWRRPVPRFDVVQTLIEIASSAIDVSDGLAGDLDQICEASGVGAELDLAQVPLALGFSELAASIGADATQLALSGGEDYEIAFTSTDDARARTIGTRIGTIVQGARVEVFGDGKRLELGRPAYRHR